MVYSTFSSKRLVFYQDQYYLAMLLIPTVLYGKIRVVSGEGVLITTLINSVMQFVFLELALRVSFACVTKHRACLMIFTVLILSLPYFPMESGPIHFHLSCLYVCSELTCPFRT